MKKQFWQLSAEDQLGVSLCDWQQVGGGDFAQCWCATVMEGSASAGLGLASGRPVFVKTHANPPKHHFTTEARGLKWLKESGAVNVPIVLGVSDDPPYLALEWVQEGHRKAASEREFGAQLAQLHQSPCSHFGRLDERSTGSLGLPNKPSDSWAEFFATQRLVPLAAIARERQALSHETTDLLERLAQRLGEFVDQSVSPSRLHGDLWAGNRLVDEGGDNWLIDPASHGGHREFDLAMMRLFGGFGEECYQCYQEHYPLDDGWRERIALHQLAPLVVHAIKFGQSYVAPIKAALARYC